MEPLLAAEPFLSPSSWDRLMPLIVAIIAATPPTIMAWRANRQVKQLTINVDGRFDALLKAEGDAGELRGREDAHKERGDREGEGE